MFWLKLVHTLIAAVNIAAIFYILYCGLRDRHGFWLNAALSAVALELACLALFRGDCPIQLYARRLQGSETWVSDLFVPDWFALHIMPIFAPVILIGLALVGRNAWRRRNKGDRAP
ncbi:MAG: hypothetical protein R3C58_02820 [Parvularculaceae bacterium]